MEYVYQTIVGKGQGNCIPACLATVFGRTIESFPHFAKDFGDDWPAAMNEYLLQFLGGVVIFTKRIIKVGVNMPYLVIGKTGYDDYHMGVMVAGNLIHDPHRFGIGVGHVLKYGYFTAGAPVNRFTGLVSAYRGSDMTQGCEECKILTNCRVYEHSDATQRKHIVCAQCLEKLKINDGAVVTKWKEYRLKK